MDIRLRELILTRRIELLREHVERVGATPGFERELAKAETALAALEQPQGGHAG